MTGRNHEIYTTYRKKKESGLLRQGKEASRFPKKKNALTHGEIPRFARKNVLSRLGVCQQGRVPGVQERERKISIFYEVLPRVFRKRDIYSNR